MYRYLANPAKHKKKNINYNSDQGLYIALSKLYPKINNELYIQIKENIEKTVLDYEIYLVMNDIINNLINK